MNNDIYQIDFTQIFPTALQHDPKMIALAKSLTAELLTVSGHMEDVLIYSRIDQLPEELVDILAYPFPVPPTCGFGYFKERLVNYGRGNRYFGKGKILPHY